ncbi:MAG: LysM peptidoglycan-binding domain-containing protein [Pseudomonadota bacterium]
MTLLSNDIRPSIAIALIALLLTACASGPAIDQNVVEDESPLQPPYYLRAQVDNPFEQIDQAIRRVGETQAVTTIDQTEPSPVDLWERLVTRFEFAECPANSRAEQWAQWFGEREEYLDRVMTRAHPWLHDIANEIERRELPGELALIPIVESAYDPFAYSHGQASGAWQFVAATAREYGLEINEFYDGRRDLHSATRAALQYFSRLNQRFDGDWNLTLAAYNGGQGRVSRALSRARQRGQSTVWSDLRLPRETLAYVPKVNGLGCLFQDPQRYGWERPDWPNQAQLARVEFDGPIDIVVLSVEAELDLTEIVALNAGLSRHLTSPSGPHHLIVPIDAVGRVIEAIPALEDAQPLRWREIEVRSGDTLSGLAVRHDTSVRALKESNQIRGEHLSIGQRLRIPDGREQPEDSPFAAGYVELAELQQRLLPTRRFRHVVRPGESLWVIARRYSVSVSDVQRWNRLGNSSMIRPGQRLMIEMDSPAGSAPVQTQSYTVRSGDSLWLIARRHQVSLRDLMRWNGLTERSILRPGQTLRLNRGS